MSSPPPQNPIRALLQLVSGHWVSRAVWAAARLGLADAVADDGSTAEEIARHGGGLDEDNVARLMNALVGIGLFRIGEQGLYLPGELSAFLKTDHPLSQRPFIESIFGGEHYQAWGAIDAPLRTGQTAFDASYGMPIFDWYSLHPEEAQAFSRAMSSTTLLIETALLAAWTPPPFELAVDVGGSGGTLIFALLKSYPEARGILFDLPDIADATRQRLDGDRIDTVGGDFFRAVPAGDLYLLKLILHDWTDEQSRAILRNIRASIRPGGHLAIVEMVLPERPEADATGYLFDLNMMVMTGGRERTAAQYGALLEATGFRLESVTPTMTPLSVVQAVAV